MNTRSESFKLVELRAKTDRQLAEYINNRLDAGLTFARLFTDPDTRSRWASTDVFYTKASEAFEEARALLPWIAGVSATECHRLAGKLEELRELLDVQPCRRAACF